VSDKRLRLFLRQVKNTYLDKQRDKGGYSAEYVKEALSEVHLDAAFASQILDEAICDAARLVWHDDPPPQQNDLFVVNGEPVEPHLTFPDQSVPGGFRKAKAEYCNINRHREHVMVKFAKAAEVMAEAEKQRKQNQIMLERAGGDGERMIYEVRDVAEAAE
jgi:hypothetical protein